MSLPSTGMRLSGRFQVVAKATRPPPRYSEANLLTAMEGAGKQLSDETLRQADSLFVTTVLTEALKLVTNDKRPESSSRDSFPSGHTSAAFSVATVASAYHPREAPLWYVGAALIGESRIRLHAHELDEVVAGAAVGYLTARWELTRPKGILLTPWIQPRESAAGVSYRRGF